MKVKLYKYQRKAVDSTRSGVTGCVVMPTGTGKTLVQINAVADCIRRHPGFGVYVVTVPRIVLAFQLQLEYMRHLPGLGADVRHGFVHSDKSSVEEEARAHAGIDQVNIESTTDVSTIQAWVRVARSKKSPLVLFSTYESCDRIATALADKALNVVASLVIADEAHHLTQKSKNAKFFSLDAKQRVFFTATKVVKESDSGLGMNNVELYGPNLFVYPPKTAIAAAKMLPPALHIVRPNDTLRVSHSEEAAAELVSAGFLEHERAISGPGRLLVVCSGLKQAQLLVDSPGMHALLTAGVTIGVITSRSDIGITIDGEPVTRKEFLRTVARVGSLDSSRMILIHYDMLTEGIDIPGMTGALMMRGLPTTKAIQTYGRVARIDARDRKALNRRPPGITVTRRSAWHKPFAWTMVPLVGLGDNDVKKKYEDLFDVLFSLGLTEESIVTSTVDDPRGIPEEEVLGNQSAPDEEAKKKQGDDQARLQSELIITPWLATNADVGALVYMFREMSGLEVS